MGSDTTSDGGGRLGGAEREPERAPLAGRDDVVEAEPGSAADGLVVAREEDEVRDDAAHRAARALVDAEDVDRASLAAAAL